MDGGKVDLYLKHTLGDLTYWNCEYSNIVAVLIRIRHLTRAQGFALRGQDFKLGPENLDQAFGPLVHPSPLSFVCPFSTKDLCQAQIFCFKRGESQMNLASCSKGLAEGPFEAWCCNRSIHSNCVSINMHFKLVPVISSLKGEQPLGVTVLTRRLRVPKVVAVQ